MVSMERIAYSIKGLFSYKNKIIYIKWTSVALMLWWRRKTNGELPKVLYLFRFVLIAVRLYKGSEL